MAQRLYGVTDTETTGIAKAVIDSCASLLGRATSPFPAAPRRTAVTAA